MNWLTDANGNKCSVEYFGSREAAQAALDSLTNCRNCVNCSGCSRCSGCSDCSDCSGCSGCSDCSDCSGCSDCSDCSGCSDCSRCSGCSDLKDARPQEISKPLVPVVPILPDIHRVVYAAASQPEALKMDAFHTCETTHCRAGWVVYLAGEEGNALEKFFNTELAAMKIYAASGYDINPCRFYDSNEDAMADMKRLAEQSK